jgi:hypothetical protein
MIARLNRIIDLVLSRFPPWLEGHFGSAARLAPLVAIAVAATAASGAEASPPHVLFVCQFGTVKSAIAREVFRQRASERGIAVTAASRGITPEDHVSSDLRARLKADGIDTAHDGVRRLRASDIKAADILVTFNPLPANVRGAHGLDWSALPSVSDNYSAARAELVRRVDVLLDAISGKGHGAASRKGDDRRSLLGLGSHCRSVFRRACRRDRADAVHSRF